MEERDKVQEWEQKEWSSRGLNPDLQGESLISYRIDHEDFLEI